MLTKPAVKCFVCDHSVHVGQAVVIYLSATLNEDGKAIHSCDEPDETHIVCSPPCMLEVVADQMRAGE